MNKHIINKTIIYHLLCSLYGDSIEAQKEVLKEILDNIEQEEEELLKSLEEL